MLPLDITNLPTLELFNDEDEDKYVASPVSTVAIATGQNKSPIIEQPPKWEFKYKPPEKPSLYYGGAGVSTWPQRWFSLVPSESTQPTENIPQQAQAEGNRWLQALRGDILPQLPEPEDVRKRLELSSLVKQVVENPPPAPTQPIDWEHESVDIEKIKQGIASGELYLEPAEIRTMSIWMPTPEGGAERKTLDVPITYNVYPIYYREIDGKKYRVPAIRPLFYIDKDWEVKRYEGNIAQRLFQQVGQWFGLSPEKLDKNLEKLSHTIQSSVAPLLTNYIGFHPSVINEQTPGYIPQEPVTGLLGLPQILPFSYKYLSEPGGVEASPGPYEYYQATPPVAREINTSPYSFTGYGLGNVIAPLAHIPTIISDNMPQVAPLTPHFGIKPSEEEIQAYNRKSKSEQLTGFLYNLATTIPFLAKGVPSKIFVASFVAEPWISQPDRAWYSKGLESLVNYGMLKAAHWVSKVPKKIAAGKPVEVKDYLLDVARRAGAFTSGELFKEEFFVPRSEQEKGREILSPLLYTIASVLFYESFGFPYSKSLRQKYSKIVKNVPQDAKNLINNIAEKVIAGKDPQEISQEITGGTGTATADATIQELSRIGNIVKDQGNQGRSIDKTIKSVLQEAEFVLNTTNINLPASQQTKPKIPEMPIQPPPVEGINPPPVTKSSSETAIAGEATAPVPIKPFDKLTPEQQSIVIDNLKSIVAETPGLTDIEVLEKFIKNGFDLVNLPPRDELMSIIRSASQPQTISKSEEPAINPPVGEEGVLPITPEKIEPVVPATEEMVGKPVPVSIPAELPKIEQLQPIQEPPREISPELLKDISAKIREISQLEYPLTVREESIRPTENREPVETTELPQKEVGEEAQPTEAQTEAIEAGASIPEASSTRKISDEIHETIRQKLTSGESKSLDEAIQSVSKETGETITSSDILNDIFARYSEKAMSSRPTSVPMPIDYEIKREGDKVSIKPRDISSLMEHPLFVEKKAGEPARVRTPEEVYNQEYKSLDRAILASSAIANRGATKEWSRKNKTEKLQTVLWLALEGGENPKSYDEIIRDVASRFNVRLDELPTAEQFYDYIDQLTPESIKPQRITPGNVLDYLEKAGYQGVIPGSDIIQARIKQFRTPQYMPSEPYSQEIFKILNETLERNLKNPHKREDPDDIFDFVEESVEPHVLNIPPPEELRKPSNTSKREEVGKLLRNTLKSEIEISFNDLTSIVNDTPTYRKSQSSTEKLAKSILRDFVQSYDLTPYIDMKTEGATKSEFIIPTIDEVASMLRNKEKSHFGFTIPELRYAKTSGATRQEIEEYLHQQIYPLISNHIPPEQVAQRLWEIVRYRGIQSFTSLDSPRDYAIHYDKWLREGGVSGKKKWTSTSLAKYLIENSVTLPSLDVTEGKIKEGILPEGIDANEKWVKDGYEKARVVLDALLKVAKSGKIGSSYLQDLSERHSIPKTILQEAISRIVEHFNLSDVKLPWRQKTQSMIEVVDKMRNELNADYNKLMEKIQKAAKGDEGKLYASPHFIAPIATMFISNVILPEESSELRDIINWMSLAYLAGYAGVKSFTLLRRLRGLPGGRLSKRFQLLINEQRRNANLIKNNQRLEVPFLISLVENGVSPESEMFQRAKQQVLKFQKYANDVKGKAFYLQRSNPIAIRAWQKLNTTERLAQEQLYDIKKKYTDFVKRIDDETLSIISRASIRTQRQVYASVTRGIKLDKSDIAEIVRKNLQSAHQYFYPDKPPLSNQALYGLQEKYNEYREILKNLARIEYMSELSKEFKVPIDKWENFYAEARNNIEATKSRLNNIKREVQPVINRIDNAIKKIKSLTTKLTPTERAELNRLLSTGHVSDANPLIPKERLSLINQLVDLIKMRQKVQESVKNITAPIQREFRYWGSVARKFNPDLIDAKLDRIIYTRVHWNPLWDRTFGDYGYKLQTVKVKDGMPMGWEDHRLSPTKVVVYGHTRRQAFDKIREYIEENGFEPVEGKEGYYVRMSSESPQGEMVRLVGFNRKELAVEKAKYPLIADRLSDLYGILWDAYKQGSNGFKKSASKIVENAKKLREQLLSIDVPDEIEGLGNDIELLSQSIGNLDARNPSTFLTLLRTIKTAISSMPFDKYRDFIGYEEGKTAREEANLFKLGLAKYFESLARKSIKNNIVAAIDGDLLPEAINYGAQYSPYGAILENIKRSILATPASLFEGGIIKMGKSIWDFDNTLNLVRTLAYFNVFFGNVRAMLKNIAYLLIVNPTNKILAPNSYKMSHIAAAIPGGTMSGVRDIAKLTMTQMLRREQEGDTPLRFSDPTKQYVFDKLWKSGIMTTSVLDFFSQFGNELPLSAVMGSPMQAKNKAEILMMKIGMALQRRSEILNKFISFETQYNLLERSGIRDPDILVKEIATGIAQDVGLYNMWDLGETARKLKGNVIGKHFLSMISPAIVQNWNYFEVLRKMYDGVRGLYVHDTNAVQYLSRGLVAAGGLLLGQMILGGLGGFPVIGDLSKLLSSVANRLNRGEGKLVSTDVERGWNELRKVGKSIGMSNRTMLLLQSIADRGALSILTNRNFQIENLLGPMLEPFLVDFSSRFYKNVVKYLNQENLSWRDFNFLGVGVHNLIGYIQDVYAGDILLSSKYTDIESGQTIDWRDIAFGWLGPRLTNTIRKQNEALQTIDFLTEEGRRQYLRAALNATVGGIGKTSIVKEASRRILEKDPHLYDIQEFHITASDIYHKKYSSYVKESIDKLRSFVEDNKRLITEIVKRKQDIEEMEGKPEEFDDFVSSMFRKVRQYYESQAYLSAFDLYYNLSLQTGFDSTIQYNGIPINQYPLEMRGIVYALKSFTGIKSANVDMQLQNLLQQLYSQIGKYNWQVAK